MPSSSLPPDKSDLPDPEQVWAFLRKAGFKLDATWEDGSRVYVMTAKSRRLGRSEGYGGLEEISVLAPSSKLYSDYEHQVRRCAWGVIQSQARALINDVVASMLPPREPAKEPVAGQCQAIFPRKYRGSVANHTQAGIRCSRPATENPSRGVFVCPTHLHSWTAGAFTEGERPQWRYTLAEVTS